MLLISPGFSLGTQLGHEKLSRSAWGDIQLIHPHSLIANGKKDPTIAAMGLEPGIV